MVAVRETEYAENYSTRDLVRLFTAVVTRHHSAYHVRLCTTPC